MQTLRSCSWWLSATLVTMATTGIGCGSNKGVTQATGFEHGMAVLNSDYASTALTLMDPNTHTVIDPCLTSGSTKPRLSKALSGDVGLTSQPETSSHLTLIDRENDNVTWFSAASCEVISQLAVSEGFHGNPHDVAHVSDTKAYITRYAQSDDGLAGNDVLIVDPSKAIITGRIDVHQYATDATVLARPDRVVRVGELAFVTLNNMSGDYKVSGAGRVLMIDTATDQVVGQIELPDAQGCSGMAVDDTFLAVGCDGNFNDPNQSSHSAVHVYDVTDALHPVLTQTLTAATLGQASVASGSLALHGNTPTFVTTGDHDRVYSGSTLLSEASSGYVLGGVVVTEAGVVFVADGTDNAPAVVEHSVGEDAQRIVSAPTSLLPPRGLLLY